MSELKGAEMFKINVGVLIVVVILAAQLQLHAQTNDETGLVTIELGKDRFAAGQDITVTNSVAGDLWPRSSEIVLNEKVGGDAVAAGGTVRLNGNFSDNAYAAGGRVYVNGTIARNARLAGGNVETRALLANREAAPASRYRAGAGERCDRCSYLQAAGGSLYLNWPRRRGRERQRRQIELETGRAHQRESFAIAATRC